jgi:hypothetical protein
MVGLDGGGACSYALLPRVDQRNLLDIVRILFNGVFGCAAEVFRGMARPERGMRFVQPATL